MRHPEGPRTLRRLRKRRAEEARQAELEARRPPKDTNVSKFGADDPREPNDRRQSERRSMSMSPQEVESWLRQNGIRGGDRRQGDRRSRGDRRG